MKVGDAVDPVRLTLAADAVLLYVEHWRSQFPNTIVPSPMDQRERSRILRPFEREEIAQALEFLKRMGQIEIKPSA